MTLLSQDILGLREFLKGDGLYFLLSLWLFLDLTINPPGDRSLEVDLSPWVFLGGRLSLGSLLGERVDVVVQVRLSVVGALAVRAQVRLRVVQIVHSPPLNVHVVVANWLGFRSFDSF